MAGSVGAPKGHPNYNTSPDPKKNGGSLGYLGAPDHYFTDEELETLGLGVIEYIKQENHIWLKMYFLEQGIHWNTVDKLRARNKLFAERIQIAKSIQEGKLLTDPYFKNADGNHARFILARHHKGEWEDKQETATTDQTQDLQKALDLINYLQSKSDRKIDTSNNIKE